MKKLVNSKKRTQMILVVITAMLIFNFMIPNYSQADMGGVLLKPVTDLFSLLGDAICGGLQMFLVDGDFFTGSGGILDAFLVGSDKYIENPSDYPELAYNTSTGVQEYTFYEKDIDLEGWDWVSDTVAIPNTKYTPDNIFAGNIPALDINFISPNDWEGNTAMQDRSAAYQLHETIATWYVALRNLAVVGLMVILVYVGIRIVISSTASDKAKYKQMMMDWLVAMCLIFCLHYIMSFTITITQEITKAINGTSSATPGTTNTIPVTVYKGDSGSDVLVQFNTNLSGLARFQTRMNDGGSKLLYTIIYLALVIYTCMFTFTYLKRAITMAFLTLMAPLVALTYPIDKINDGKAQAFNSWLKEYVFNALLQPFHLIIYTILVTSAMNLAATNPIYAIVALAFITPAEKMLRKFFGFEKASTAGTLGAFANMAGGAAAYKMISNAVNRHGGKGGKGSNGGNNNIRTRDNRQLEDPNAPSGVDGFTGHNGTTSETNNPESLPDANETMEQTPQQAMLDAYDEGFGTDDWDPQERDAMARDANQSEGMNYSAEEYAQILRDSGYEEGEIPAMLTDAGYGTGTTENQPTPSTGPMPSASPESPESSEAPHRNFVARVGAGVAGVGRSIANKASTTIGNKHWVGQKLKRAGIGVLKGGVHIAARTAAAVPTAILGLSAGIAGDNLEDVLTYGIGGATLGATVLGNRAVNAVDRVGRGINNTVIQGFADGYYGTTQMEREVARQERELQADPSFMQQVNEQYADGELSGKELKAATARAAKFVSYGVDQSKIGKTMKVEDSILADLANTQMEEEEKKQLAREQATTAAKMAAKINNPEALVGKKGEELQRRWAEQIQAKNKDLKPREAQKNAKDMMKMVRKIKGI